MILFFYPIYVLLIFTLLTIYTHSFYTTLLTLMEFLISGQHLLLVSVRKIIWLPPSGRSHLVKAWELDVFFFIFNTFYYYLSMISRIFMLQTLVLLLQLTKLISDIKIPDNHLSWLLRDLIAEMPFLASWIRVNRMSWVALA